MLTRFAVLALSVLITSAAAAAPRVVAIASFGEHPALQPERLIAAYGHGIFPWPHPGWPMLWFSPDPRWALSAAALHVPRRLARTR